MSPKKALLAVLFFSGLLLARAASATDVLVDCSGTVPTVFHTITDALNFLDPVGPHTITVSGTCRENLYLAQRDRVIIQAVPGRTATIENAAQPAAITFLIVGSHNITLDHLIIQGGTTELYVTGFSGEIALQDCILQGSSENGLVAEGESSLRIENSTIRNNGGSGVAVSNQSFLVLGTTPNQRNRIIGNAQFGLSIDGAGVQVNFGRLLIQGNRWAGITMDGGRLLFFGGEADNPAIIQNNNTGISMNNAASATFWSASRITQNGNAGVLVQGASSITFNETTDSNGKKAVTTISGHSVVGLDLRQSSSAQLYGAHMVVENGSAIASPSSRGGISMEGASLKVQGGTSISHNVGPGIRLGAKSDLIISNATVAQNTAEGVRETNLSAGGFYNPLTFIGNGGVSLYCDNLSVAFGDASTIPGVNCANLRGDGPRP